MCLNRSKHTHTAPCLSLIASREIEVIRNKQGLCVCYFLFVPLRRGGGAGGAGGARLDVGQAEREGPFLVQRPQSSLPQPTASRPQIHRSLSLLRRIWFKCRKEDACRGLRLSRQHGQNCAVYVIYSIVQVVAMTIKTFLALLVLCFAELFPKNAGRV